MKAGRSPKRLSPRVVAIVTAPFVAVATGAASIMFFIVGHYARGRASPAAAAATAPAPEPPYELQPYPAAFVATVLVAEMIIHFMRALIGNLNRSMHLVARDHYAARFACLLALATTAANFVNGPLAWAAQDAWFPPAVAHSKLTCAAWAFAWHHDFLKIWLYAWSLIRDVRRGGEGQPLGSWADGWHVYVPAFPVLEAASLAGTLVMWITAASVPANPITSLPTFHGTLLSLTRLALARLVFTPEAELRFCRLMMPATHRLSLSRIDAQSLAAVAGSGLAYPQARPITVDTLSTNGSLCGSGVEEPAGVCAVLGAIEVADGDGVTFTPLHGTLGSALSRIHADRLEAAWGRRASPVARAVEVVPVATVLLVEGVPVDEGTRRRRPRAC